MQNNARKSLAKEINAHATKFQKQGARTERGPANVNYVWAGLF